MTTNIFYLVRHAHAYWSPEESRPLSEHGLQDAQLVAACLASTPLDHIYTSPYTRARQTVAPLAQQKTIVPIEASELRERTLGKFSQHSFLAAVRTAWNNPKAAHPGGESNLAAQRRVRSFFDRLQAAHSGEHILLSTHGNLLALLLNSFDSAYDFSFWRALSMPDIYRLELGKGGAIATNRVWQTKI